MKTLKPSTMVKRITTAFSLLLSLAATIPATAQKKEKHSRTTSAKPAPHFLEAIEIQPGETTQQQNIVTVSSNTAFAEPENKPSENETSNAVAIEGATTLQLKYAVLLNTEVEALQNVALLSAVDEWYGTPYELGGSTKDGIDCSAFVQAVYNKVFQIPMPRTAKEQYKAVQTISRTELKAGDLVFFNTHGSGVSHVGIYLQNNKFVHAATSGGVMVSDLYEEYWVKHFVGAGHFESAGETQPLALKP
jgi:murein DD-endopeptidase / murein LD-carboxypeptidase